MNRSDIDYVLLYKWSWGVSNVVSLLYGVLVVGIGSFLLLVSSCDIMYINNRLISREKLVSMLNKDGKLRLISRDAIESLEQSYTTGKNVNAIYIVRRAKLYLISASTLVALVTNGSTIVSLATSFVTNVLQVFGIR